MLLLHPQSDSGISRQVLAAGLNGSEAEIAGFFA
jgi:hypothetical protein